MTRTLPVEDEMGTEALKKRKRKSIDMDLRRLPLSSCTYNNGYEETPSSGLGWDSIGAIVSIIYYKDNHNNNDNTRFLSSWAINSGPGKEWEWGFGGRRTSMMRMMRLGIWIFFGIVLIVSCNRPNEVYVQFISISYFLIWPTWLSALASNDYDIFILLRMDPEGGDGCARDDDEMGCRGCNL